jgi:hypothetical protein
LVVVISAKLIGQCVLRAILWVGPPIVVWSDELDSYAADDTGFCGLVGSEVVVDTGRSFRLLL